MMKANTNINDINLQLVYWGRH